jgi:hypothetical protein
MLKMKVKYLTPAGKVIYREKLVRSLLELEESIRMMRAMGFTPQEVRVSSAKKEV